MPYYDTIAEDLRRAREILERGKPDLDGVEIPPELQAYINEKAGGAIIGADIYAAYMLLRSFVAEIEALRADAERERAARRAVDEALRQAVEDRDFWERKAGEERVLVEAVGRKVAQLALRHQRMANEPAHIPGCTCIIVNGEYRSTERGGCPVHLPGTRVLTDGTPLASITCPRCGKTSYHPKDVSEKYCGNCHEFHEDMPEARQ